MPLTHRPPPQPVAATHATEVAERTDEFAEGVRAYLHALFARLILPHTEWSRGAGISATSTGVTATVGPSQQSTDVARVAFQTLGLPQTTAGVASKAVLLAIALLKREPAPRWEYFYDGVLLKTVAQTVPLPPAPPAPGVLGDGLAVEDIDDDNFREYVDPAAASHAALLAFVVDKTWRERWAHVTRWWYGTVTAVQVAARTATVRLDAFPGSQDTVTQSCGFGTRAWSASQLQGKRVRVGYDRALGWWVDDWA